MNLRKGVGIDHHNKSKETREKIMHLPEVANLSNTAS